MITFFLIWTLVNGHIADVDAFLALEGEAGCQTALSLWNSNKARVQATRPGIQIDLIGCIPVELPDPRPTVPERPKESAHK